MYPKEHWIREEGGASHDKCNERKIRPRGARHAVLMCLQAGRGERITVPSLWVVLREYWPLSPSPYGQEHSKYVEGEKAGWMSKCTALLL